MASPTRGPGRDSMSGAKLGLYGTIATAIIGAISTIVAGVLNQTNSSDVSPEPQTAIPAAMTITPTASQVSDSSSAYRFVIGGTGEVTVSGSAQSDVVGVYVLVGPKPSGGFWGAYANVSNRQWEADVLTDPPWQGYQIEVRPYYGRPSGGATGPNALKFTFPAEPAPPAPPPPPPPDEILRCAQQFGSRCFYGPAFGPPSVYQSNQ